MSNKSIYGSVFYEYSFSRAIKERVICDFDVAFLDDSLVESDKLVNLLLERKKANKRELQETYLDSLCIPILKAREKYKIHHLLVFVNNTEKLKILEKNIINMNIENCFCTSIYSNDDKKNKMNKNEKLRRIKRFTEGSINDLNIMITVSMFDEGVSIPIIDSILFGEERDSENIIVQNIGRALRLHDSKKKAIVILPMTNNTLNGNVIIYSNKFIKIRNVIDTLRNNTNNCRRYTTSRSKRRDTPSKTEQDISNDLLHDNTTLSRSSNTPTNVYINNDTFLRNDTFNYLNETSIEIIVGRVSNTTLKDIKDELIELNITNIIQLSDYLQNNIDHIKIIKLYKKKTRDHIYDWVCYGHLMNIPIFTLDEAMEFIHSLNLIDSTYHPLINDYCVINNIDKITKEIYFKMTSRFIDKVIYGDRDELLINLVNNLILIPYNISSYYTERWELLDLSWDKFLGLENGESSSKAIINPSASIYSNSDNNFNNIINKENLLNRITNEKGFDKLHGELYIIDPLKHYLNKYFRNYPFNIKIDFIFPEHKRKLEYNKIFIKCFADKYNSIPLMVTHNYEIKYDSILDEKSFNKIPSDYEFNRNKTGVYIPKADQDVRDCINSIIKATEDFIKTIRSQNLV
jgi:hypothetical protein